MIRFIDVSFLYMFIKKNVSEQINLGISKTYTKTSQCLPPRMSFTGKTIINTDCLLIFCQMHKLLHILKKEQTIYNTVFHELIRQVSVDCADRGELLSKIRFELLLEYASFLLNFVLELYLYLFFRKSQKYMSLFC